MNFNEEEIEEILNDLANLKVKKKELLPFKKQLLLVSSSIGFELSFLIDDLLKLLPILKKEGKLDIIDKNFIEFVQKDFDILYFNNILEGITFNESRFNDDIEENERIIRSLCACFSKVSDIISNDITSISYLMDKNQVLGKLSIRYTSIRTSILESDKIELDDKLVLVNVLDIITTYIYINYKELEERDDLIDISIYSIILNLSYYRTYFLNQHIFDTETSLGSMSSDGIKKEFLVIGNLVNDFYKKEANKDKVKQKQRII